LLLHNNIVSLPSTVSFFFCTFFFILTLFFFFLFFFSARNSTQKTNFFSYSRFTFFVENVFKKCFLREFWKCETVDLVGGVLFCFAKIVVLDIVFWVAYLFCFIFCGNCEIIFLHAQTNLGHAKYIHNSQSEMLVLILHCNFDLFCWFVN